MPTIFDVLCQEEPTVTGPSSLRTHRTVPGSHCSAWAKSARYGTTIFGGTPTLNVRDTVLTATPSPLLGVDSRQSATTLIYPVQHRTTQRRFSNRRRCP